jgi:deoxycytidylate deaminase
LRGTKYKIESNHINSYKIESDNLDLIDFVQVREHMQMLHEEKNELLVADWDPHAVPHATEYVTIHTYGVI